MATTATSSGNVDIPTDIAATLVNPAAYADHRIHDSYRWLRANTRSASPGPRNSTRSGS